LRQPPFIVGHEYNPVQFIVACVFYPRFPILCAAGALLAKMRGIHIQIAAGVGTIKTANAGTTGGIGKCT
jgi:hypothetical protein